MLQNFRYARLLSILALLIFSTTAFAHQPFVQVKPGQVDLSIDYRMFDGATFINGVFVDSNNQPKSIYSSFLNLCYNGSGGGLNSVCEMGIIPGWSVGVNLNVPQAFFSLAYGNGFALNTALYTNISIVDLGWYRLNLHGKAQLNPLFRSQTDSTPNVNCYAMLGSGFKLIDWPDGTLSAYIDIKAQTSFVNTFMTTINAEAEKSYQLPSGSLSGVPYFIDYRMRIAAAIGLDLTLGSWIFSAGWNFPLAQFSIINGTGDDIARLWSSMFLNNAEITIRLRL